MQDTVRAAHQAGVTVLAGTDSHPCGTVADEVAWLYRCGVPAEEALAAASWRARAWLGLPGLNDGAPADLVAYDTDPTLTPQAIPPEQDHPARTDRPLNRPNS